jgi:hypothetical protein
MELEGGGEVQIVVDLEQAGLEEEEGGDQIWVAADEAEWRRNSCFRLATVPVPPSPSGAGGWRISHGES